MNKSEALAILKANQPLPSDSNMPPDLIRAYDEARKFFLQNKNEECIPLFLGSFGDGSGFGVYQLVEDVLRLFSVEQILPHLRASLLSEYPGVRYWSAQIASGYPHPSLVPALFKRLSDPNPDTRIMAAIALGRIGGNEIATRLRVQLDHEDDQEVAEALSEALQDSIHDH